MAMWVKILLEIQPAAGIQRRSLKSEYEGIKLQNIITFILTDVQFYEEIFVSKWDSFQVFRTPNVMFSFTVMNKMKAVTFCSFSLYSYLGTNLFLVQNNSSALKT